MNVKLSLLALPLVSLLACPVVADDGNDRVDHFEGKASESLEEAVAHFTEGNDRLRELLSGDISDQDMADIHELTYTLENAVARLREEMDVLAVVLEDVHLASESFKAETVEASGDAYMDMVRKLRELGEKD